MKGLKFSLLAKVFYFKGHSNNDKVQNCDLIKTALMIQEIFGPHFLKLSEVYNLTQLTLDNQVLMN